MKKIRFLILVFLILFIISACKKQESLQQENEKILSGANQLISLVNKAFLWENMSFSWYGNAFLSGAMELNFTGDLAFSGQEIEGNFEINLDQKGTGVANQLFLFLQSQIRKSDSGWYFFPRKLVFSQGDGNIQAKFLQLILNGLLEQWVKIDQLSFPFSYIGQLLRPLPLLFSWSAFQKEMMNTYLSGTFDKLRFLTWTVKSEKGKRSFDNTIWNYGSWELLISGDFDGKLLKMTCEEWRANPLELLLTSEKDQLLVSGKWWISYFNVSLSSLGNQDFSLEGQIWKGEQEDRRTEFITYFSHKASIWALQSLPNTYISLEKYLADLNIGF